MLNRKVTRVLSERIDTPDLTASLKHLSTFYSENTWENRRNLRSKLEKQSQSLNDEFIESFQCIVDEFETVSQSVNGLFSECERIEKILNETKKSTSILIETTTKLRNEKKEIMKKEEIVSSFLDKFELSKSEKAIFDAFIYENVINFDLFSVFAKMTFIRNECKKLLSSYHQRASLDIMDRFAKLLETGYEKLYRSVQQNARNYGIEIDLDTNDEKLKLFAVCLNELRQRSGYFEHCVQELASARRLYLVQTFLNALSGANGQPGIEMYAYDPVRYLNDMLTWIHNALIKERGFSNFIFDKDEKYKINYLDRAIEGVFRPLNMRILSVLNTKNFYFDVVTAYRLCHCLDDFIAQIVEFFDDESVKFLNNIKDLNASTKSKFYQMAKHRMDKYLQQTNVHISASLMPSNVFKDHLERLKDVMAIYANNSMPNKLKIENFTIVLNSFIDPMLEVVNKSISDLTDTEQCVYLINSLILILETLKIESFTMHSTRFETLSFLVETQKEKLIECESSFILKDCGVFTLLLALKTFQQNQRPNDENKMCNVQGLDEKSMKFAMKSLSAYIFSLGALSMPKIEKITDLKIRLVARNGVAKNIFNAYKLLFDTLSNGKNGYVDCKEALSHSLKEVKKVLQLN